MKKKNFIVLLLIFSGCGGNSIKGFDEIKQDFYETASDAAVDSESDFSADNLESSEIEDASDLSVHDLQPEETFSEFIQPVCQESEPCDDHDPCTVDDICFQSVCAGKKVPECNDNLSCTYDSCDSISGKCYHAIMPGTCLYKGICFKEGDINPANPCEECISLVSKEEFSPDDGNECESDDPCFSAFCYQGKCVKSKKFSCNDKNSCTFDYCDNGECRYDPVEGKCDDGDACTTGDFCDLGVCKGKETIECSDSNPCTKDICNYKIGCEFIPNSDPCEDGNFCTEGDKCENGACKPGKNIKKCSDDNICTDDFCVPYKGCVFIPNNVPCDDNNKCTIGDVCYKGNCSAGKETLKCGDENICTDHICDSAQGCVVINNNKSCDDKDPCFLNDFCFNGECVHGNTPVSCDDFNSCTDDSCETGVGCVHIPNSLECNDFSVCTENDRCKDSVCDGTKISCDDGNVCTDEFCDKISGCYLKGANKPECRPVISITYPPRGATFKDNKNVLVTGVVKTTAGPVASFSINGTDVKLQDDGKFEFQIDSKQGMNLIVADASDIYDLKDHVVQSYYYSTVWYATDVNNPPNSFVKDGLMIFLGPEVWDDNDKSDIDDFATIMAIYVDSMDLNSLIKNPVKTGTFGWCSYKVNVTNMKHGPVEIDLTPIEGGLFMHAVIPDFSADISIPTSGLGCPSFSGKATATSITIDTTLLISVDQSGNVDVTMQGTQVKINGLNIQLEDVWGFLLNWLIDFFEDTFASEIASSFEKEIGSVIPAAVEDALSSLALDQEFEVKPFMGAGDPVKLKVKTNLSSAVFTAEGGVLGMNATVVTPKLIDHNPLGSIGRAKCLSYNPENFGFPKEGQLEMSLHDDFFNQIPFGIYYGSLFKFSVTGENLGQDLSQYGITDLKLNVDFLLPPVITSCNVSEQLVLQIGDIFIHTVFNLFNSPVEMDLYASMEATAHFSVVDGATGKEIGLSVDKPTIMELEIEKITGSLSGIQDVMENLIKTVLIPELLESFTGSAFGSFPVPAIDLSTMNPSIPEGTSITIDLKKILRIFGYTVLSGAVKSLKQ
jgi:hypothetical protein